MVDSSGPDLLFPIEALPRQISISVIVTIIYILVVMYYYHIVVILFLCTLSKCFFFFFLHSNIQYMKYHVLIGSLSDNMW